MSIHSNKTTTFSLDSLNKLYFQFINKFVLPNLQKTVLEITKLLMINNAFEVHKFLQNLLKSQSQKDNTSIISSGNLSNNISNSNSTNNAVPPLFPYAIAVPNDSQKHHSDKNLNNQKKEDKHLNDSITFKPLIAIKRSGTSTYDDYYKSQHVIDQKTTKDDTYTPFSVKSLSKTTEGLMSIQKKTNTAEMNKNINNQHISHIPVLSTTKSQFQIEEQSKQKLMKEIVKKISKVFNDNQSKIERYTKASAQNAKYLTQNSSNNYDWKQEQNKQYHYIYKPQTIIKRY